MPQFLTMIKSLAELLNRVATINADNIGQHVYQQIMTFVAGPLTEAIGNAGRKKKPTSSLAYEWGRAGGWTCAGRY